MFMPNRKVYWAVPVERNVNELAVRSLLGVAIRAGELGYAQIVQPHTRIDVARNNFVRYFLNMTVNGHPDDTLIMLDNDETHPANILEKLADNDHHIGVVGGLYFRRGAPYDPLIYTRLSDNSLGIIGNWPKDVKLIQGAVIGTGAIAIKRWVFDKLQASGFGQPYFRYEYPDQEHFPTEDMYFGKICEASGIPHYMDVTVESGHITNAIIDHHSWEAWQEQHPDEKYAEVKITGEYDDALCTQTENGHEESQSLKVDALSTV